jgi:hypothetical protein
VAAARRISRLTVKKILNHAERDVTAIYDRHSYHPEKRTALEAWGRRLDAIVSAKPPKSQIAELSVAPQQAIRSWSGDSKRLSRASRPRDGP